MVTRRRDSGRESELEKSCTTGVQNFTVDMNGCVDDVYISSLQYVAERDDFPRHSGQAFGSRGGFAGSSRSLVGTAEYDRECVSCLGKPLTMSTQDITVDVTRTCPSLRSPTPVTRRRRRCHQPGAAAPGSFRAMRTIRHQPRGLRHRTCTILKKLLQHHTRCHHQWVKRHDSESLQAEVAAARWAWLGPTLLVRAREGGEHADGEEPNAWDETKAEH